MGGMRIEHPNSSPSTFNSRLLALWCCVLLIFATSLCKVMLYKYLADSLLWQSCINRTRVIGYYFSATSQPNNNKKHRTITPCVHVDPSFFSFMYGSFLLACSISSRHLYIIFWFSFCWLNKSCQLNFMLYLMQFAFQFFKYWCVKIFVNPQY